MAGTVNAIVPLSLLEAVRSVDIPEGEDVDVEYVQEHRNKRLGLSDTVIAQIRRYKEALKRKYTSFSGFSVGCSVVFSLIRLMRF